MCGHLVEEIKLFIHGNAAWKIQHVRRDSIQVAHYLANNALLCNHVIIDLEDDLLCISFVVLFELVSN